YVSQNKKQKFSEACRPIFGNLIDGITGKVIDLIAIFSLVAATATTFSMSLPLLAQVAKTLFHVGTVQTWSLILMALIVIIYLSYFFFILLSFIIFLFLYFFLFFLIVMSFFLLFVFFFFFFFFLYVFLVGGVVSSDFAAEGSKKIILTINYSNDPI